MKKAVFLALFCFAVLLTQAAAQDSVPLNGVEISFSYNRQSGFASNQFAVWIEDSRGRLVQTLFAPRFTASGGWARRELSIPLWVSKSGLASLSKNAVDAFSGATPRAGALSYRWDGREANGSAAAPGEYRIFLEATLRNENRVLYSAPFTLGSGSPVKAEVNSVYFGNSTKERRMIEKVEVFYRS